MKIRCDLHLGGLQSKVILVAKPEETAEHLALKLAAVAMFLSQSPIVDPSSSHTSLGDLDLKPDVMIVAEDGGISHWIECGTVSINKLDKITRRLHSSRVVVLKSNLREAKQQRQQLQDEVRQGDRVEIWAWPERSFKEWLSAIDEKTELFGDAHEKSLNLVVNEKAYSVDLLSV